MSSLFVDPGTSSCAAKSCHYCHAAEATHCIFYDPRAIAYRAEDVTGDPPGHRAHVPYACGSCAEARSWLLQRDELDAKDRPPVRVNGVV